MSHDHHQHAALDWLSGLGWTVAHGPDIASDPPDKQDKAIQTVLEQAEVLSEGWAVA